jgi:hypothetical protein
MMCGGNAGIRVNVPLLVTVQHQRPTGVIGDHPVVFKFGEFAVAHADKPYNLIAWWLREASRFLGRLPQGLEWP